MTTPGYKGPGGFGAWLGNHVPSYHFTDLKGEENGLLFNIILYLMVEIELWKWEVLLRERERNLLSQTPCSMLFSTLNMS